MSNDRLRRARLTVDVVNDDRIEPVLEDLREALMRTGHGPRITIRTSIEPWAPKPPPGPRPFA